MTPKQIKKHRTDLGYTRVEFARALGFKGPNPWRTCQRWESGARVPWPQVVDLMMKLPVNLRGKKDE